MKSPTSKDITLVEALAKAQRYCALQERCHSEMRSKLLEWGVRGDTLEQVLAELIAEGFLNEERYACAFARGKFRIKGWGRNRIEQELRLRRVSDYCIRKALAEIEDGEYRDTLEKLLRKKAADTRAGSAFELQTKLLRYAVARGFETELVFECLHHLQLPGPDP